MKAAITPRAPAPTGVVGCLRRIARAGKPPIRTGPDIAMRMTGEQFVTGRTIDEAIQVSARAGP